jgi:hypothetical protein
VSPVSRQAPHARKTGSLFPSGDSELLALTRWQTSRACHPPVETADTARVPQGHG